MKNLILLAVLSACLLLGGCVSLLERSYSVVEPYADRYWDSAAEDTLKAENYQDLVNSLLMQVEQRAEECVIRGYGEAAGYGQARSASWEVRRETIPGSYLLENMTFDYEPSDGYSTFTFRMSYREDAEDIEAMMSLSDCQSLVDLLRLSVREDHHRLTARFIRDMRREEVRAAVEALWQELCRGEKEDVPAPLPEDAGPPQEPADGEESSAQETPPSPPAPGPSGSTRIWTARGSWRSSCRSDPRCNIVPRRFPRRGGFFDGKSSAHPPGDRAAGELLPGGGHAERRRQRGHGGRCPVFGGASRLRTGCRLSPPLRERTRWRCSR